MHRDTTCRILSVVVDPGSCKPSSFWASVSLVRGSGGCREKRTAGSTYDIWTGQPCSCGHRAKSTRMFRPDPDLSVDRYVFQPVQRCAFMFFPGPSCVRDFPQGSSCVRSVISDRTLEFDTPVPSCLSLPPAPRGLLSMAHAVCTSRVFSLIFASTLIVSAAETMVRRGRHRLLEASSRYVRRASVGFLLYSHAPWSRG